MANEIDLPEGTAVTDQEAIMDEQIQPLLDKALQIARENNIPFMAMCEYAPDKLAAWAFTFESAHPIVQAFHDLVFDQPATDGSEN